MKITKTTSFSIIARSTSRSREYETRLKYFFLSSNTLASVPLTILNRKYNFKFI